MTHDNAPTAASPAATLVGLGAILLWSALALLTASAGAIPPFELAALTFAIGGGFGLAYAAARGRLAALIQPWPVWAVGVGGLFGYHALYFAALRRAPPAEASLIAYLWPLLIVLFSALLPGERLRPAMSSARRSASPARRRCSPARRAGFRSRRSTRASRPATRWRSAAPSSGRAIRCCRAG